MNQKDNIIIIKEAIFMDISIVETTVFALTKNGGNPCPVVLNADDLSAQQMKSIAKAQGIEVGFITASEYDDCDFQFRYFVPNNEMEMCVHATIACATVLVQQHKVHKNKLLIETLAGKILLVIHKNNGRIVIEVEQLLPKIATVNPIKAEVANVLNINIEDIDDFPIKSISTSRYKTLVKLKSNDVLQALRPDFEKLWKLCDQYQSTGFYPFTQSTHKKNAFSARQFPNNTGYNEDPATGVAASALGIYLELFDLVNVQGDNIYITQGEAIKRHSEIMVKSRITESNTLQNSVLGEAAIL